MKQILPRCSLENPDRGLHLLDVPQSWQTMSFLKERERKEKGRKLKFSLETAALKKDRRLS